MSKITDKGMYLQGSSQLNPIARQRVDMDITNIPAEIRSK
jgi:hypothetical protein